MEWTMEQRLPIVAWERRLTLREYLNCACFLSVVGYSRKLPVFLRLTASASRACRWCGVRGFGNDTAVEVPAKELTERVYLYHIFVLYLKWRRSSFTTVRNSCCQKTNEKCCICDSPPVLVSVWRRAWHLRRKMHVYNYNPIKTGMECTHWNNFCQSLRRSVERHYVNGLFKSCWARVFHAALSFEPWFVNKNQSIRVRV